MYTESDTTDKKMTESISFGTWLRQHRRALDLTQQAFADQVGCARITLSRIEADTLRPSQQLASIILEKVGIPQMEREQWVRFARGLSGLPSKDVQSSTSVRPQTNLPASLTSFIGREKEQAEIIKLITKHRLITLTGSGGVGKTRLSLKIGEQVLEDYRDGVWLGELAPLSDPMLLPQNVAAAFGITVQSNTSPLELLINFLQTKTLLLLLDNCEHLMDACAQLTDTLLKNCPQLKILATSREALGILGEVTYRVPSLRLPAIQQLLEKFRDYESVRLFEERAQLAQTEFALTRENAPSVAQICSRLDGIPLAIELAAARVNMFSTEQIAARLKESFNLLTGGSRIVLPRHQTIRASIDWSWNLLTDSERILLRRLSVFAGGWTLESAESVCSGNSIESHQVLELMTQLVAKSLMMVNQAAGRDTRYHFHEIIRQYAHEKLSDADEEENARSRHLRYFLQFTEQAEATLRGPTQIEWYARLNAERNNLRTALAWAVKINDVEAGLYLSGRLGNLWEQIDLQEGIRWLTEFTQNPKSHIYPLARAKALLTQGWFLIWLLKYSEAQVVAQECLEIYRAQKDRHGEIDALVLLARSMFQLTELEQSLEVALQALALSRSLGDKYREARSLMRVGECRWHLTTYRDFTYIEQAIHLNRKLKNWSGLAGCMVDAGRWVLLDGNLQVAEKYAEESISLFRQLENKRGLSMALEIYGRIALARGDSEKAHTFLRESVEIREEIGERMGYLWSRSALGYCTLWQGDIAAARHIFSETAQEFFKEKVEIGVVFNLEGIAGLYIAEEKPASAARLIGWADATRERIKDTRPRLEQPDVDKIIAACLAKMGEVAFSEAYEEGRQMSLEDAVEYALRDTQNP
jgi:predicted ATPase/DNA-binding XRE family transcriptional regulator